MTCRIIAQYTTSTLNFSDLIPEGRCSGKNVKDCALDSVCVNFLTSPSSSIGTKYARSADPALFLVPITVIRNVLDKTSVLMVKNLTIQFFSERIYSVGKLNCVVNSKRKSQRVICVLHLLTCEI